MKFSAIRGTRSQHSVKEMCRILQVSRSGYYAWKVRSPSPRRVETAYLRHRILQLYTEHRGAVGSPMLTADLRAEPAFTHISRQRVARHMRCLGLRCRTSRRFVVTTDSRHTEPVAPNLLNRAFSGAVPDTVWVTDITYLKVGQKWNYLTVFIDLFSRMVVGWDLSGSLERYSVIKAFHKALKNRRPGPGLMVHSDRGHPVCQLRFPDRAETSWLHPEHEPQRKLLGQRRRGILFPYSRQCIRQQKFPTAQDAELALFQYIEIYYNRRRRHASDGWMAPAEFERCFALKKLA